MQYTTLFGLAASIASAAAQQGFNYGATKTDGTPHTQEEFEALFNKAKGLPGTNGGFTSARLYTMIQAGTADTPISAIPAAIDTQTSMLLGLWTSAGDEIFANELIALQSAIDQYGSDFTDLIDGISVGSEDLYRVTPTAMRNNENPGIGPSTLADYINQCREALQGTGLSGAKIGHVDTWTAWVNGSNDAVIEAVDWVGFDGYPYFQNTIENGIDKAAEVFQESYDATVEAAQGKPVWVTETGWPVSGPQENDAEASPENAEQFWQDVACKLLGNTPTWWYTLQDAQPDTPSPSFGIIPSDLSADPLYDLSCGAKNESSSSSSSASSKTTGTASAAKMPSSAATTGTASISVGPGPMSSAAGVGGAAPYPSGGNGNGTSPAGPAGTGMPGDYTPTGSDLPEQTGAASKMGPAAAAGVLALFGLAVAI